MTLAPTAAAKARARAARARDPVRRRRAGGFGGAGESLEDLVMSLIYPKESLDVFPAHLTPAYKSTIKRSPKQPLVSIPHTLSELSGPVYGHDAVHDGD